MINLYAETDMNEKVMIKIAELPDVKTCFKFHKAIYKYHQDNVDFKLEDEDNLLKAIENDIKTGRTKTIIASTKMGSLKEDVGMIEMRIDRMKTPTTAYITALWIEDSARNKGIASILLSSAEAVAKKDGVNVISLDVFDFNTGAVSLYLRMGYKCKSHDKTYKATYVKKL